MLEDGILDQDESDELLSILNKIRGESSEIGELAKTSTLPVDEPAPELELRRQFVPIHMAHVPLAPERRVFRQLKLSVVLRLRAQNRKKPWSIETRVSLSLS